MFPFENIKITTKPTKISGGLTIGEMFLSSTLLHAPDLIFTQPDVRGAIFTAPFYR